MAEVVTDVMTAVVPFAGGVLACAQAAGRSTEQVHKAIIRRTCCNAACRLTDWGAKGCGVWISEVALKADAAKGRRAKRPDGVCMEKDGLDERSDGQLPRRPLRNGASQCHAPPVGRYPGWRNNPCSLPRWANIQWQSTRAEGVNPRPLTVAGTAQVGRTLQRACLSDSRLTAKPRRASRAPTLRIVGVNGQATQPTRPSALDPAQPIQPNRPLRGHGARLGGTAERLSLLPPGAAAQVDAGLGAISGVPG